MEEPIKILTNKTDALTGSDGKWAIDAEGNCFLAGRLCVEGWVDPTFLLLTNQTSAASVSDNSLATFSEALSYKDNTHVMNTITADLARIKCRATNTNSVSGISIGATDTTILSLTITPTSTSVRVLVQAAWTGNTVSGDERTPTIKLMNGATVLSTYTQGTGPAGTRTQPFGGAIAALDTTSGVATRTYTLKMNISGLSGSWEINNASLSLMEAQADT